MDAVLSLCTCFVLSIASAHSMWLPLPTLQMKPIYHIRFNNNANIWDAWEFTALIMADRHTAASVCDYVFLLSTLAVALRFHQTLSKYPGDIKAPSVSNASCGYRDITLLPGFITPIKLWADRYQDPQKVINQRDSMVGLPTTVAA